MYSFETNHCQCSTLHLKRYQLRRSLWTQIPSNACRPALTEKGRRPTTYRKVIASYLSEHKTVGHTITSKRIVDDVHDVIDINDLHDVNEVNDVNDVNGVNHVNNINNVDYIHDIKLINDVHDHDIHE